MFQQVLVSEDGEVVASFGIFPEGEGTGVNYVSDAGVQTIQLAYTLLSCVYVLLHPEPFVCPDVDSLREKLSQMMNAGNN